LSNAQTSSGVRAPRVRSSELYPLRPNVMDWLYPPPADEAGAGGYEVGPPTPTTEVEEQEPEPAAGGMSRETLSTLPRRLAPHDLQETRGHLRKP
jgi:hypothetical protein